MPSRTTYRSLPDVRLSATRWDAMQVPVGVAFFFVNSAVGQVAAFYPSPAGATESLLPLDAWDDLVADHPELADMAPDVEALLVRVDDRAGEAECFVVPIDACYELVGQLRRLWKGFDGGAEARAALEAFFANVRRAERIVTELSFEVVGARAERYAVQPTLVLRLRISRR